MSRSSIFLGDLANALNVLDPDDADAARSIARLLGVDQRSAELKLPLQTIDTIPPEAIVPSSPVSSADEMNLTPARDLPVPFLPSAMTSIQSRSKERAAVRVRADVLPPVTGSESDEQRPSLDPLLRPTSTRAILSAILSSDIPRGIDVDRAVARIAGREPLDRVPVRTVRSVRRGAQILLDKSGGMTPFFHDQSVLTDAIVRVLGRQAVSVASFIGAPQRGLLRGMRRARPYQTPPRSTPILLLTDFGIADAHGSDGSTIDEWLGFVHVARRAGCPLFALVPYPPKRWPRELHIDMTMLWWDRTLTAAIAGRRRRARR
jgi:hypothetical protein